MAANGPEAAAISRSPPRWRWVRGSRPLQPSSGCHGTALGPAPDRLAVAAAPEFLGSGGAAIGTGRARIAGLGWHGDGRALPDRRRAADQPRSMAAAGIRAAHGLAHGGGARRLAGVQPLLCDIGSEDPAGREDPDPGARHPAIGADPWLSVD